MAEFSGQSGTTTPTFEVDGNWMLQWTSSGDKLVYINVETPDGRKVDGVSGVNGDAREPFPGRYRLVIDTLVPWHLRVLKAAP